MDRTILDRLNDSAKANDILYFLGDFCIGSKVRALEQRKQIRCKKIFAVPGNHDKQIRKLTEEFSWLSNLAEISIHGQTIVLCRYAMRFVAAEILKSQADRGMRKELYYFRDQQGLEVDFLVPRPNAKLWLIEAKAAKTVRPAMASPLTSLQRALQK